MAGRAVGVDRIEHFPLLCVNTTINGPKVINQIYDDMYFDHLRWISTAQQGWQTVPPVVTLFSSQSIGGDRRSCALHALDVVRGKLQSVAELLVRSLRVRRSVIRKKNGRKFPCYYLCTYKMRICSERKAQNNASLLLLIALLFIYPFICSQYVRTSQFTVPSVVRTYVQMTQHHKPKKVPPHIASPQ